MREFIRGWRRKIGMLTLAMACVFMAVWIRSLFMLDQFWFYAGNGHLETLYSFDSKIGWLRDGTDGIPLMATGWSSHPSNSREFSEFGKCRWISIHYGEAEGEFSTFWDLPYWSIVLPLTALSSFLLLQMPCKSKSKKITEPTANDGA